MTIPQHRSFMVPENTTFVRLPLHELDLATATFWWDNPANFEGAIDAKITLSRESWERVGRPGSLEIPLVEKIDFGPNIDVDSQHD